MNIEKGKYWDVAVNPIVHDKCNCEVGDRCWARRMIKRGLPGMKLGYFPERLSNIDLKGKPKVYAINWLCDIAYNVQESGKILGIIRRLGIVNEIRMNEIQIQPHTFLILTKFPDRLFDAIGESFKKYKYKTDGLWIGTSISGAWPIDDSRRIYSLLRFRGFKLWVSYEPVLGWIPSIQKGLWLKYDGISQVIVGAETGAGARPCNLDWIRTIRDECAQTNVPFFLKQINSKRERLLDGRTHNDLAWRK